MSNSPKSVTNIEVINNVEFPSDHRIVRATLSLKNVKKNRKHFKNSTKSLETEDEIKTFLSNLGKNIDAIPSSYKENVQSFYDAIENCIKNSLKIENTQQDEEHTYYFFSETTKLLIKRRSELLKTENKNNEQKKELSSLFKQTSKCIRKDFNLHKKKTIEVNLIQYRSAKRAFKQLHTHSDWIQTLNRGRNQAMTRKDVLSCATEFYRDLYATIIYDARTETETTETNTNEAIRIQEEEVLKHIKKLKHEKSPGPDGLRNESLKIGAPLLTKPLTCIFNMVLSTGQAPKQWYSSDIILLYKKGNPLDIANYRPISLLSTVYKLFTSIIQDKINPQIDSMQPVEQAGFRSGFSTMDHIHTMEQVMEKYSVSTYKP
ncbi:uncharacterized protein LOC134752601 [Cydia strobilella]|uniref:uncharacterized protein LOC134752601 n=1 Tax=Cydia strobilella TaxID=1100964 RepID=UPI003007045B